MISSRPKLVTIFGGSGFIGRHVVQALARRGYRVRVACRNPNSANFLQPLGSMGQIHAVQANVRHRGSVERAVEGADHVINLVGIMTQSGKQRFEAVQAIGARTVAEATREAGATLVQASAIGADENSGSVYARTKAHGEKAAFETLPNAVVIRPSIVFGQGDRFFNRFAGMARFSPVLPLIGGGHTRFEPVYVRDVAELYARAVEGDVPDGQVYEAGGPEILTFRECMEEMLRIVGRKRMFVSVPWSVARLQGHILQLLPGSPLTVDQVTMLATDNIVSEQARSEGRTLEGLGMTRHSMRAILPTYLWTFRPAGQFTKPQY